MIFTYDPEHFRIVPGKPDHLPEEASTDETGPEWIEDRLGTGGVGQKVAGDPVLVGPR
ncbi:MAG: hypothetical protein H6Q00_1327 [Holophagaceae bacterium]|nr:hypothetical protein [Holophagaceae bacterium]